MVISGYFPDFTTFACYFGALEVKIVRAREDELCVNAPAHPPGVVTVCVMDVDAQVLSNHLPYIYIDPQAKYPNTK